MVHVKSVTQSGSRKINWYNWIYINKYVFPSARRPKSTIFIFGPWTVNRDHDFGIAQFLWARILSEFPIVHTSSTNDDQRSIIDSRREIKLKKDNSKDTFQNKIKITMKRFLGIFILRILEGIKVLKWESIINQQEFCCLLNFNNPTIIMNREDVKNCNYPFWQFSWRSFSKLRFICAAALLFNCSRGVQFADYTAQQA